MVEVFIGEGIRQQWGLNYRTGLWPHPRETFYCCETSYSKI